MEPIRQLLTMKRSIESTIHLQEIHDITGSSHTVKKAGVLLLVAVLLPALIALAGCGAEGGEPAPSAGTPAPDLAEDVAGGAEGYMPSVQLEDLEPFLEWLSAEETADGYVLRLSGGGDTFEALARDLFRQRNFGEGGEEARDAGDMAVHRLECECLFDKKTHFIKSIRLYMELTLSAPEGDYAGTFDLRGEYSRINEIPGIPLPEDTVSVDLGF